MKEKILKDSHGASVDNDQATKSLNLNEKHGYALVQDTHLLDKLAHFARERVPERVVHAKGAGAHGKFVLTNDMSKYTDAKIFTNKKVETPIFVRFSTVGGESGSADAARDPRGFAVRFYTEEGNYDITGNNTPIFFIRDAIKFPDFIHTQKRHPQTNLKDNNMVWDFWSLTPESLHQVMFLFTNRGTPKNHREMSGYGSHAFMWYKGNGEFSWVKYHFVSTLGFNGMNSEEADEVAKNDPDHATRDLFENIKKGNFPKWKLFVQILSDEQVKKMELNPFDVTKVWYHRDAPLVEVGEIILNKNPDNYFTETEQITFSPGNFVPGIAASPDKLLQGRLFSYGDAARYRVGANHNQLDINRPKIKDNYTNERAGFMASSRDYGSSNNYFPNSQSDGSITKSISPPRIDINGGWIDKTEVKTYEDDFVQPNIFYTKVLSDSEKVELIKNLSNSMMSVYENLKYRQVALFFKVSQDLGTKLSEKLKLNVKKVKELSELSQDERIKKTPLF